MQSLGLRTKDSHVTLSSQQLFFQLTSTHT